MKRLIQLLLLAALAFGYYKWPSFAAVKFKTAMDTSNQAAVKASLDLQSFQRSMAEQKQLARYNLSMAKYGPAYEEDYKRNHGGKGPDLSATGETPETLDAAFPEEIVIHTSLQPGRANLSEEKWESPLAYSVTNKSNGTKYIFRLRLTGWKLCGAEFGMSQMQQMVKNY